MKYGTLIVKIKKSKRNQEKLAKLGLTPEQIQNKQLVHLTRVLNEKVLQDVYRHGVPALLKVQGIRLSKHNVLGIQAAASRALEQDDFALANVMREREIKRLHDPRGRMMSIQDLPENHSLYAFKLDSQFANKQRFQESNPHYKPGQPVVFMGTTELVLHEQFLEHTDPTHPNYKRGARVMHTHGVKEYSDAMAMSLLEGSGIQLTHLTFGESLINLATGVEWLRQQGVGVWTQ